MLIQVALGRKYIIVADTVEQRKINGLSFAIKRFLIRRATMLFVPGKRSRDFFATTFNVDESKICLGAYSLDGRVLEDRIALYGKERRCLRSQYGIGDGDRVFLMVANMIKTRHYPITSEAFLRATRNRDNIKFIMVGRGPELECMQELATRESALIVLPGVSFDEMLKLYALSDVYVHGGTEPASTALVIGAIAHLPLISSPAVGCFADVVIDGETGYAVNDYLSVEEWESAFVRALDDMSNWKMKGERARVLSRTLDSDRVVEEFSEKVLLFMGEHRHGE
jgi:glycosyltransferase involved in cell wall biosynthesis